MDRIYLNELEKSTTFKRGLDLEPLILLVAILEYCILQGYLEKQDLKARLEEAKKARQAICK